MYNFYTSNCNNDILVNLGKGRLKNFSFRAWILKKKNGPNNRLVPVHKDTPPIGEISCVHSTHVTSAPAIKQSGFPEIRTAAFTLLSLFTLFSISSNSPMMDLFSTLT